MRHNRSQEYQKEVEKQLRALGATYLPQNPKDMIFNSLVKLWKGRRGSAPNMKDLYQDLPMLRQDSIRTWLQELLDAKRVLHPAKGVWIPIIDRSVKLAKFARGRRPEGGA